MSDVADQTSRSWASRATEQSNLFNPAFMATLAYRMVQDYTKKARRPMPLPLIFLFPAIILHRRTRDALPNSTATALLPWLQDNKQELISFAGRARLTRLMVQEGLMFGLAQQCLAFEEGGLIVGKKRLSAAVSKELDLTQEARECLERAAFLGRWFAGAGTSSTIMAAWGVTP